MISDELLAAAKNYLDITYKDEAVDQKLQGILLRGIAYLENRVGMKLPFEQETQARALLFDYAMYVRAGALAEFEQAYRAELTALRLICIGGQADENAANI